MKKLLISVENAEFQIIESLKNNRTKRAGNNEIFIEGIESIKQAFKAGLEITRIITTENISSWAKGIINGFQEMVGLKIIEMSGNLYRKLCDRSDPSEMLVTAKMPLLQLGEVALPEKPFVLVLDRPSDTGNLGSIIRSANSFGVDAVLCIGHGVDPWDPKTIRASLGSIFFTTPIQIESLEEFQNLLESMRGRYGIKVWGTDSGGDLTLDTCVLQRPLVLILGNEAKGISQALKVVCDGIISIPVTGAVNSLNIASAASIFMWEVFKDSEWIA